LSALLLLANGQLTCNNFGRDMVLHPLILRWRFLVWMLPFLWVLLLVTDLGNGESLLWMRFAMSKCVLLAWL
jgi:hypothetical protein